MVCYAHLGMLALRVPTRGAGGSMPRGGKFGEKKD